MSTAEIPAIRQYVPENQVLRSCGLVVEPSTFPVSSRANLRAAEHPGSDRGERDRDDARAHRSGRGADGGARRAPVSSFFPADTDAARAFFAGPHGLMPAVTTPAAVHSAPTGLIAAAGAARPAERQPAGDEERRDPRAPAHFAVVPRCSKKLTRPGAEPTTRAAAPEIKRRHPSARRVLVVVGVCRHRPQPGADERTEQGDRQRPRLGAVDERLEDVAARQVREDGVRGDGELTAGVR